MHVISHAFSDNLTLDHKALHTDIVIWLFIACSLLQWAKSFCNDKIKKYILFKTLSCKSFKQDRMHNIHKQRQSTSTLKLYAHGMRPVRFLSACVWFRDITSFSGASGMVCVRVEPVSILTHRPYCSDSLLLERRPYQMHQKRTWRHEIRCMRQKNAQDACRVHTALQQHIPLWIVLLR